MCNSWGLCTQQLIFYWLWPTLNARWYFVISLGRWSPQIISQFIISWLKCVILGCSVPPNINIFTGGGHARWHFSNFFLSTHNISIHNVMAQVWISWGQRSQQLIFYWRWPTLYTRWHLVISLVRWSLQIILKFKMSWPRCVILEGSVPNF